MTRTTSLIIFCGLFLGIYGAWFDNAVFYQVYPQSYKEGKGGLKGNGDLKGITEKLDYIKDLGVDAIWLNPFYEATSHGYDIKDFKSIDPKYGNEEDFKTLTTEARKRDIKIIMDFVPNHVSSEHEWFQKSIKKTEPYTEYFIWRDGKFNNENPSQPLPPNNWLRIGAQNGESAWEWNKERGQFYFFQFGPGMPDLNLRNETVKKELQDALEYWLKLGISGWRIDAISHGYEDEDLRDEPLLPGGNPLKWDDYNHTYTVDQNESFQIVYEWRAFMNNFSKENNREDLVIMTESYTEVKRFQQDPNNSSIKGADIPFFFNMIFDLDQTSNANRFIDMIYNRSLERTTWVIGNHDQRRTADRVGKERIDLMNALLLLFGRATVTYYGEEIGMYNVCNFYNEALKRYQLCDPDDNRGWKDDMSRTPFQWDNTKNAGFSEADHTLFPVPRDFASNNLKSQIECATSHYHVFKDLVKIKKSGFFQSDKLNLTAYNDNVLYGIRIGDKVNATILVNMNGTSTEFVTLDPAQKYFVKFAMKGISELTVGYQLQDYQAKNLTLRPYEVLVFSSGAVAVQFGILTILIGVFLTFFN